MSFYQTITMRYYLLVYGLCVNKEATTITEKIMIAIMSFLLAVVVALFGYIITLKDDIADLRVSAARQEVKIQVISNKIDRMVYER